jgi:FtsP/CotA-like multicopper oxidase with cupredoxin domain
MPRPEALHTDDNKTLPLPKHRQCQKVTLSGATAITLNAGTSIVTIRGTTGLTITGTAIRGTLYVPAGQVVDIDVSTTSLSATGDAAGTVSIIEY